MSSSALPLWTQPTQIIPEDNRKSNRLPYDIPANQHDHCQAWSRLDQDDFWLNHPKSINLIVSKVLWQLYGFVRTHVAIVAGTGPDSNFR